jgi:hypothetical protein
MVKNAYKLKCSEISSERQKTQSMTDSEMTYMREWYIKRRGNLLFGMEAKKLWDNMNIWRLYFHQFIC